MTPNIRAGEAVPKITRRLFLARSAAVGAVGVGATIATGSVAQTSNADLSGLIARHTDAETAAKAAERIAAEIYADPSRPPYAWVEMKELQPIFRTSFWSDPRLDRSEINEVIGRRRAQITMARNMIVDSGFPISAEYDAKMQENLAAADAEEARVMAVFSEREAERHRWDIESGHLAADEEADRLWGIAFDLFGEIRGYRCKTIEDIQQVAQFLRSEYPEGIPAEFSADFIAQLAGGGSA